MKMSRTKQLISSVEVCCVWQLIFIAICLSGCLASRIYEPNGLLEIHIPAGGQDDYVIDLTSADQVSAQEPRQEAIQKRHISFNNDNYLMSKDNLKRYLFKDLDGDGYQFNSPAEHRRWIKLKELLETLGIKPIYRSGRTYPPAMINDYSQSEQFGKLKQKSGKTIGGMIFPPIKASLLASSKSNIDNDATTSMKQPKARPSASSIEEVAYSAPIHGINDYEFKRVENTRWNNLRGMWGKRSVPDSSQQDLENSSNANEQQQKTVR